MTRPGPTRVTDLSRDDWRALSTLMALVPVLHVAIKACGYPRVRAWIERTSQGAPHTASSAGAHGLEQAYGRASRRLAARPWWPGNCLSRSLAVMWMLRRRGIQAQLRLGVQRSHTGLDAHAWVEVDGRVVNDRSDVSDRFAPLTTAAARFRSE